jgi:hypothetical protein
MRARVFSRFTLAALVTLAVMRLASDVIMVLDATVLLATVPADLRDPGHQPPHQNVHGDERAQRPKRRSRSELLTTETLEKAIAAAAIIGLSRPEAARGMAAML